MLSSLISPPEAAGAAEEPSREEHGQVVGYVQPGFGTLGMAQVFDEVRPQGLRPLIEQRWAKIVRQRVDAGCGPASLATIYTHYLDLSVTERDMSRALTAEALRSGRGRRDIRRRGYALGDLKRVVDRSPLVSAAFRAPVESLRTLKIPVITQVNIRGYGHFVILRGVVGDRVVVADPNFGNLTYPLGQFRAIWSGVMLAIGRPVNQAVAGARVDPTQVPMVTEIDYALFIKNSKLPNLRVVRYAASAGSMTVNIQTLLTELRLPPLLGFQTTITRFKLD